QRYLVHYIGLKHGVGLFSSHSFIESLLFKNVKGLSSTFWTAPNLKQIWAWGETQTDEYSSLLTGDFVADRFIVGDH
ncbi:hypothetical protein, partial [Ornatilinea apprima]|uniref:hypothetical protein n=1 Tax=Ornatilinea apprima TaxID=1134406 RepID=UPI001F3A7A93